MLAQHRFNHLFRAEMRKEFLATYNNLIPCNEMPKLKFDAETACVDAEYVKETHPAIKLIQEHLKPLYNQQRVFQALREFISAYDENVDDLSITQKRNITRILNKLHED